MTNKEEAEKILEGLSQEERLKLLERLIQGAEEAREEELTAEERIERLEDVVFGGRGRAAGERVVVRRLRRGRHVLSDVGDNICCCC